MMAAADRIEITLTGRGGHGAMPHLARDPVVAGAQIVSALQTIVARNADPIDRAVVSITQFHAGDADNVIPETAMLGGTARSFTPAMQDLIERRLGEIAQRHRAGARASRLEVRLRARLPGDRQQRGRDRARARPPPSRWSARTRSTARRAPVMGAEDFAFMLEQRPGSYVFIGNGGGDGRADGPPPRLRLQRRGAALRRELLGAPGRARAAGPLRRRGTGSAVMISARATVDRRSVGAGGVPRLTRQWRLGEANHELSGQASLVHRDRGRGRADHRLRDVAGRRGGARPPPTQ